MATSHHGSRSSFGHRGAGCSPLLPFASLILAIIAFAGGVRASLVLRESSPILEAATRLWIDEKGWEEIKRASEREPSAAEALLGLLIMGGVAIAADQANENFDLVMVEIAMHAAESTAIQGGGKVDPAGREAAYACAVLEMTPWPVIGIAAVVVWGFGAAVSGTAARSMALPIAFAVGVGAAYALEAACANSLL